MKTKTFSGKEPYSAPFAEVGANAPSLIIMASENVIGAGSMFDGEDLTDNDFFTK